MEERLSKEELHELRGAILFIENLRLQAEIADRDFRDLKMRLASKYGIGSTFRTDTGVIVRAVSEEGKQNHEQAKAADPDEKRIADKSSAPNSH